MPDGGRGLRIVEVSDLQVLREAGSFEALQDCKGVAVYGENAYLANGASGLHVLDVSSPSLPVEVASYDTPGDAEGVAVAGNLIYVADGGAGLLILRRAPMRLYLPAATRNCGSD